MAERRPQTYENHTRLHPFFHCFLLPLAGGVFVGAAVYAFRHPAFTTIWMALACLVLLLAVFLIRVYSLKVQDRVIRLEERLRLASLLPERQRARIGEFTVGQLIALRFAADEELPGLATRALDEHLAPKDIKKSIRNWRGDYFRV